MCSYIVLCYCTGTLQANCSTVQQLSLWLIVSIFNYLTEAICTHSHVQMWAEITHTHTKTEKYTYKWLLGPSVVVYSVSCHHRSATTLPRQTFTLIVLGKYHDLCVWILKDSPIIGKETMKLNACTDNQRALAWPAEEWEGRIDA